MTRALRNIFLLGCVAALTACGGGGGGGDDTSAAPPANPGNASVPDVSLAQLQGSWFGSFDATAAGGNIMAAQFDIDQNGNITDVRLDGQSKGLIGTVTKAAADEGPRLFRFVLREVSDPSKPFNQGILLVDPSHTHLFYIDEFREVAALQFASAAPSATYVQADTNGSWNGDSAKTAGVSPSNATPPGTGFGKLTPGATTATCQAAAPASSCTITVGSTTRNVPTLTLNSTSGGRWTGTYTETPNVAGSDKAINVYVSPDKKYAGGFTCATLSDFTSCNFYSLTKP